MQFKVLLVVIQMKFSVASGYWKKNIFGNFVLGALLTGKSMYWNFI